MRGPVRNGRRRRPLSSIVRTHVILEAPTQVQRAVLLLWAAWGIGVISVAATMIGEAPGEFWVVMAIAFWLNASLIHRTSKRGRWARLILLGLAIVTIAATVYPYDEPPNYTWWEWVEVVGVSILEIVALFWLFTGEGANWFARRAPA
jgi:hypothetical protein